jgi:hypothetical protein
MASEGRKGSQKGADFRHSGAGAMEDGQFS